MITLSEYRSDDKNVIMADINILALNLMFEHGLIEQGWFYSWDRSKARNGLCNYTDKIISMSKYLAPVRTYDQNKNTILHEIAHVLVGAGHGHDAVWKAKAIEIGSDGERCGKIDAEAERPEHRWVGKCSVCDVQVGYHRAPNRVRTCPKCAPWGFDFKYVIDWFEFGEKRDHLSLPERYVGEYQQIQWSHSN